MKRSYMAIIIIIFVLIGASISLIQNQIVSKQDDEKETKLIFEDDIIEDVTSVVVEDNEIYVPITFLEDYLDLEIKLIDDGKRAFIELKDINFELETEKITEFVEDQNIGLNLPILIRDNISHVPMNQLSKLLAIELDYNYDSEILIIDKITDKKLGSVKDKKIKIKSKPSMISETVDELGYEELVRVFGDEEDYYRIRTEKGYLGFVKKEHVSVYDEKKEFNSKLNYIRSDLDKSKNINITWEYVYEKTPDNSIEEKIEGLDVVSPTWFSLSQDGVIINKADSNYVKNAHDQGYMVWGLVDNSFDPDLTSKVINDDNLKNKVIAQILFYSSLYDLDGINIDFENVYYEDKDALSQFVEELTTKLKEQNLVVSIDVTVPGGSKQWSLVYDRERIAKVVDFVALMAYDEHWGTSPVSGSVASIGWVEKGITRSLETIPEDKLLLGIPFYTRVWEESIDSNGKKVVSSKAIPIKNVQDILKENNAQVIWNEKVGQNFATYEKDGKVYKIWIEDEKSIELKLNLAQKYNLKGIASWRKGYEHEEVWEVIKTIKENKKSI